MSSPESPVRPIHTYDEAALPSGELRPDWRTVMTELEELGTEELERRRERGQRLLRENGVTYNVYGDPRGMDRPWQLDAVPFLISSSEWEALEAGIRQRATLLSSVLADLYGPQRLVKDGWLPPELLFEHPGFLRPCHGLGQVPSDMLTVYSADLARSPDGQWWVLSDRTQAPSGQGYALENRVVLSRTLPELFRAVHVHRLAGYFEAFREALMAMAPRPSDQPQVVLLTPGPYNETYFEHAYLSRYLGFPLVEGADLTVRDERLFLKTLSGLRPVDVVLRRQDDAFCDPLELYGESALGVAGLVQAVRAGNVAVANGLGSGLMETAAIMAFLPGLCRQLLGEELRIPSVATWWCGQERELAHVVDHLDELVIKPTYPGPSREIVFGQRLAREEREAFERRLFDAPSRFVAQEQVALSTAPTSFGDGEQRHLVLRVFAVATRNGYVVMPGGLTRVGGSADSLVVSSQAGGGSKDTWVLADAPVPYVSRLERVSRPIDVNRDTFALTSRVADNLFWLGRMTARLEAGARLYRTALGGMTEEDPRGADPDPPGALDLLVRMGRLPSDAATEGTAWSSEVEDLVLRSLYDAELRGSLRQETSRLHRLAWLVRDRISAHAWRILSRLEPQLSELDLPPLVRSSRAVEDLDELLITLSAFTGLVMDSTTRGLGWRFLEMGRRIERGLQVIDLLSSGLPDDPLRESGPLQRVLEIADCSMTYRSRYLTSVQLPLVIDLLILDEANPRSLAFQLVQLVEHLRPLERVEADPVRGLLDELRAAKIEEIVEERVDDDGERARPELEAIFDRARAHLGRLSDALNHAYLSHAQPGRQPPPPAGARP